MKVKGRLNRKGDIMSGKTVVIIVGVVGIIIVLGIVFYFMRFASSTTSDKMCVMGCNFRHMLSVDAAVTIHFWPQMCNRRSADITADRWDLCPEYARRYSETKDPGERADAVRSCAIQQIADLVLRCWQSSGSGTLDPGPYDCFQFKTKGYSKEVDLHITPDDLKNFMKKNNVTGTNNTYGELMNVKRVTFDGAVSRSGDLFDEYYLFDDQPMDMGELWIVRFADEGAGQAADLSLSGKDEILIYPAMGVKVVEHKGKARKEGCIKDPSCFEVCGSAWGDGYSDDLGKTCYAESECVVECTDETVEGDE